MARGLLLACALAGLCGAACTQDFSIFDPDGGGEGGNGNDGGDSGGCVLPGNCSSTASSCGQSCMTDYQNCLGPCGGNQSCRNQCKSTENTCFQTCLDACVNCVGNATCASTCQAAVGF